MTMTFSETTVRPTPKAVIISAWAVPVMVVGQFAMLAIIPLGIAVAGILRNRELHALRGWVIAVAGAYGAALLMWRSGPTGPQACPKNCTRRMPP